MLSSLPNCTTVLSIAYGTKTYLKNRCGMPCRQLSLLPEYSIVSSAVFLMVESLAAANTWFGVKRDYSSAFRYGKRALALASTDEEKIGALQNIAVIYGTNDLYADVKLSSRGDAN